MSAASAAAVTFPPLPWLRPRLTTRAPWASATSDVPSSDASSPTQISAPGKALASASIPDPIRSASLWAAMITSRFVMVAPSVSTVVPVPSDNPAWLGRREVR